MPARWRVGVSWPPTVEALPKERPMSRPPGFYGGFIARSRLTESLAVGDCCKLYPLSPPQSSTLCSPGLAPLTTGVTPTPLGAFQKSHH